MLGIRCCDQFGDHVQAAEAIHVALGKKLAPVAARKSPTPGCRSPNATTGSRPAPSQGAPAAAADGGGSGASKGGGGGYTREEKLVLLRTSKVNNEE